jgi:hypothetical protein
MFPAPYFSKRAFRRYAAKSLTANQSINSVCILLTAPEPLKYEEIRPFLAFSFRSDLKVTRIMNATKAENMLAFLIVSFNFGFYDEQKGNTEVQAVVFGIRNVQYSRHVNDQDGRCVVANKGSNTPFNCFFR